VDDVMMNGKAIRIVAVLLLIGIMGCSKSKPVKEKPDAANPRAKAVAFEVAGDYVVTHEETARIGKEKIPGYKLYIEADGEKTHFEIFQFRSEAQQQRFADNWHQLRDNWQKNANGDIPPDNFVIDGNMMLQYSIKTSEALVSELRTRFQTIQDLDQKNDQQGTAD
jgi:hypothetical protein